MINNHKNNKNMKATTAELIFERIEIVNQPKGEFKIQVKVKDESVVFFYDGEKKEKYLIMFGSVWHCDKYLSELFAFHEIAQAIIYNKIF